MQNALADYATWAQWVPEKRYDYVCRVLLALWIWCQPENYYYTLFHMFIIIIIIIAAAAASGGGGAVTAAWTFSVRFQSFVEYAILRLSNQRPNARISSIFLLKASTQVVDILLAVRHKLHDCITILWRIMCFSLHFQQNCKYVVLDLRCTLSLTKSCHIPMAVTTLGDIVRE